MIYIVTALKSEAQAFVDKFKLRKSSLNNFTSYVNDSLVIIVSGVGAANARFATQALIDSFDITDEDVFYNVGVCAAPQHYDIGSCCTIGSIVHDGMHYTLDTKDTNHHTLQCCDTPQSIPHNTLVDMESYGFYDAIIHNPAIKKYHIIKIVSDHFEPDTLSKDMVKSLIFQHIPNIITAS